MRKLLDTLARRLGYVPRRERDDVQRAFDGVCDRLAIQTEANRALSKDRDDDARRLQHVMNELREFRYYGTRNPLDGHRLFDVVPVKWDSPADMAVIRHIHFRPKQATVAIASYPEYLKDLAEHADVQAKRWAREWAEQLIPDIEQAIRVACS